MKNIKPVYVSCDQGVTKGQYAAVMEGVSEVLSVASMGCYIPIHSFAAWRQREWLMPNGSLAPFRSIDWYVEQGRNASCRQEQLDCDAILRACIDEPWQEQEPHYDIVVVSQDLFPMIAEREINFVLGISTEGIGTVLSTYRFATSGLNRRNAAECLKTTVMHELGHAFGLVQGPRAMTGEFLHRNHCPPSRRCIMRQGMDVEAWVHHTRDRLQHGPYCRDCRADLRTYFR